MTFRSLPPSVVAVLFLVSCGGGSGGDAGSKIADTATVPVPETTAIVETTTIPPETTTIVETTTIPAATSTAAPPPPAPVDLGEFCDASLEYAVRSDSTEVIDDTNAVAFAALIGLSREALVDAVDTAPEEYAAEPARLLELIDIAIGSLIAIGYDVDRSEELPAEFFTVVDEIDVIEGQLDTFLLEACDTDINDFQADAVQYAHDVAVDVQKFVAVSDESGHIVVEVPAEWSDVDGSSADVGDALLASRNINAFDSSNNEPGIFIASFASSDVAWPDLLDSQLELYVDERGCSSVERVPYDDATYLGTEVVLSCPNTTRVSRVIAGTNAPESISFIMVVVHAEGRTDIRDKIEETVFVDLT